MEIFKEPIHYQNPRLCLKVWTFTQHKSDWKPEKSVAPRWHYHKEVEFIMVLDGVHEMHTLNESLTLVPDEVMVVGSNQLHRGYTHPDHDVRYIVLHVDFEPYFDPATMNFSSSFIEALHPLDALNGMFRRNPEASREAGIAIRRIHDEVMRRRHGYEIAVSMLIKSLMLTLIRHDEEGILSSHEKLDAQVLRPVIAHVDENLGERISMTELSRLAGMSYVYFSKYFKSRMGISFTEYVNRKRIAKASRMLAMGDRKVTDIAASVGLENMAHFYEMFRRFNGCTPKQFKSRMRGAAMQDE
ncbi:MAG: transcriptional regulator, AraC family [Paenibacillus sp.]|nr:transcriptional regulator, AraC family [Paenibacillus sp.]